MDAFHKISNQQKYCFHLLYLLSTLPRQSCMNHGIIQFFLFKDTLMQYIM